MHTVELLQAVRDGQDLPVGALEAFIGDVGRGTVPDYQVGAFLMAVRLVGLTPQLTARLTLAMRDSGTCLDLTALPGIKVDKHSTGGVGDKISLALAPWVAACGVPVPMVSGRGLGHTGGTLDKLEAIPGFCVQLTNEAFVAQMRALGVCLMGQTASLAPADRRLYAVRDVTATIDSVPLITASILAKKLAEGSQALVMDIKVGRGAFMRDLAAARLLARSLIEVGTQAGLRVSCLLTRMDSPLGTHIGNALEVLEAIAILRGAGPPDTTELTLMLGAEMLCQGGVDATLAAARARLVACRDSGSALAKLGQIIRAQGGDPRVLDEPGRLPQAPLKTPVLAPSTGYLVGLEALILGQVALALGAGRRRAEEAVDPAVGLVLHHQVGAAVTAGMPLLTLHHRAPLDPALLVEVGRAIRLAAAPLPLLPLLLERHDAASLALSAG